MAFSFTATAQPLTTPPSVLLNVTRATGTATTIHMDRADADGVVREVRTETGGPLDISSGSAAVTDYEYRYGTQVTYQIREELTTTQDFSMDVDGPWLTHIGVPSRSVALDFRIGTNEQEEWAIEEGVFPVIERSTPIVITSGARQEPVSSLTVSLPSLGARTSMKTLLADGSVLLLNVSPTLTLGIDSAYISIGTSRLKRPSTIGTEQLRDLELPYRVVGRPDGGTRAAYTWTDEAVTYALWSSIPGGTTWATVAAGP